MVKNGQFYVMCILPLKKKLKKMHVCPTTGVSRKNWKAVQYSVNNGSVLVVRL